MLHILGLRRKEGPPEDRSMADLAVQLLHACRTGDFPYPGGLRDQPRILSVFFEIVLRCSYLADAAKGGLLLGGGSDDDEAEETAPGTSVQTGGPMIRPAPRGRSMRIMMPTPQRFREEAE